jgi:hypothetical protein
MTFLMLTSTICLLILSVQPPQPPNERNWNEEFQRLFEEYNKTEV